MLEFIKTIHFASLTWIMILPLSLMGIDVLTGLFNALWKEKNFKSSIMRAGLVKKVGEIAIILIGLLFTYGMTLPLYIMKAVSLYLIIMELMSIFENLDKMGVPLPKFVKDVVNNVGHSLQNDSAKELAEKVHKLEAVLEANGISYKDIDDLK